MDLHRLGNAAESLHDHENIWIHEENSSTLHVKIQSELHFLLPIGRDTPNWAPYSRHHQVCK